MFKYSVSVKWSDEDKGFIATVPELPGLSAFGETRERALSELKIAAEAYLATLKESGASVPSPTKVESYSGQIRFRMPKGLHARLAAAAEVEGISLNTYIVSLLSERHGEQEMLRLLKEHPEALQKPARIAYQPESDYELAVGKAHSVREKKARYK